MSTEKINNQNHLNRTNQEAMGTIQSLKKELSKENRITKVSAPVIIESNTIQQLLSQQSEIAKQQLTKRSMDHMQEKGQIHNQDLEEEINREMDRYFTPRFSTQDEASVSNEYNHTKLQDNDQSPNEMLQAKVGAQQSTKKDLEKVKKDTVELTKDEDDNDDVKLKTTKPTQPKKEANQPKINGQQINHQELKEYAKSMSKFALSQDPNAKQKLEQQKQQLLSKGISNSEINHMSSKVAQVIKQHMVYDLKQKLINFHMSKASSKQEHIQQSLAFQSSTKKLENLQFNKHLPLDISQTANKLKFQAKQDLGNFLYEESVAQFTKQSLGQISLKEFTEELVKLQKAAQSAGVEISEKELTEKIFSAIDHLGLAEFTRPNTDSQQQKPSEKVIVTQEEALDDKLRYLYMMKALHPSLRNKIDIHFKVKKCRNGMIKLGFYTEEKENNLKRQGEFLAANQFKESLHFIFREEATLPHLTGSQYGVLRKKKAFFLSQLRKVNHGLTPDEVQRIKESTYREMYGLMKEELLQLKEMAEIHKHVSISRKIKHLTTVINRIKSDIQIHDFQDTIKNLTAPIHQSNINEGA